MTKNWGFIFLLCTSLVLSICCNRSTDSKNNPTEDEVKFKSVEQEWGVLSEVELSELTIHHFKTQAEYESFYMDFYSIYEGSSISIEVPEIDFSQSDVLFAVGRESAELTVVEIQEVYETEVLNVVVHQSLRSSIVQEASTYHIVEINKTDLPVNIIEVEE